MAVRHELPHALCLRNLFQRDASDDRPDTVGTFRAGGETGRTHEHALNGVRKRLGQTASLNGEARRDANIVKQDKANIRWQVFICITAILILGAWIRWPV